MYVNYRKQNQRACDTSCEILAHPPIYGCTFSGKVMDEDTCDQIFGTMSEALSYDGICDGTDKSVSDSEREDICYKRALRLKCPTNPTIRELGTRGFVSKTGDNCGNRCDSVTYMKIKDHSYDYRNGPNPIFSQPTGVEGVDWVNVGSPFNCTEINKGGINYLNNYSIQDCKKDCAENYKCDVIGERIVPGTVFCAGPGGGACFHNTADVSMSSDQLADSNIKAEMVANITNDFQSEVMKTITQANEGLNFSQFNTSDEMTEITQIIKNSINNNIQSATQNDINQTSALNQDIDIEITGSLVGIATCAKSEPIDYSECNNLDGDSKKSCQENILNDYLSTNPVDTECVEASGACGCDISNSTVQDISNKQVAKSVIDSIFNSSVLNNLASSYTLTVDQLNKGPTLGFIWIIIALIIGGAYVIGQTTGGIARMGIGGIALILIIVLLVIGYSGGADDEDENEACRTPETGCLMVTDSGECNQYGGCEYTDNICKERESGVCGTTGLSTFTTACKIPDDGCLSITDSSMCGEYGGCEYNKGVCGEREPGACESMMLEERT